MTTEAQVPGPGKVFLDHVGWYVPDMGLAADQFERLGFVLTPYTEHRNVTADGSSAPSGTANRCAMLERGYLEILTAVPGVESALAHQLRAGLERYQGVHVIAFTGADAAAERARLTEAGFDPQPVVNLRRPVAREEGGTGITAFSVIRIPPERMPEGRVQFLAQETPELVWQLRFIARDNAVEALTGILLVVADVAEAANRYAHFTGRHSRTIRDGGAVIILDRGRIAFAGAGLPWAFPGGAPTPLPVVSAVALRSRDLNATRSYLARERVRLTADANDHLIVHPDVAAGTALVIHTDGADECLYCR
jgi:hypothetical protein